MNWFAMILFGILSGLTEFLPISVSGHQGLFCHIYGISGVDPILRLCVSAGALASVAVAYHKTLQRGFAERAVTNRRGERRAFGRKRYDLLFVKTAFLPIVISTVIFAIFPIPVTLPVLVAGFILNGIILFISGNMRQGSKDARHMTKLDSLLTGSLGCLSIIPGVSRVGTTASACIAFGAGREHAVNWANLISIPVLITKVILSLLAIFTGGTAFGIVGILLSILAGACAYIGGHAAIRLIRFISVHLGISGFSYYGWGAAMLAFILFLIT